MCSKRFENRPRKKYGTIPGKRHIVRHSEAVPPGREFSLSGPRNRHSGRTGRKRKAQPNRKIRIIMIAHTIQRIVCLGCLSLITADMSARDRALEKSIRAFLRDRQATVAVAVLSDGRMIASIEEKAELPTMSVFKFY